jgi:hypothetical protein
LTCHTAATIEPVLGSVTNSSIIVIERKVASLTSFKWKEKTMKKFQERLNIAQSVICVGILCIALGLVTNFISVVYAQSQCPNLTVRNNSPCVLLVKRCVAVGYVCPSEGETSFSGKFQNDVPSLGKTTMGSGQFLPCYDRFACILDTTLITCVQDPYGFAEAYDAETLVEVNCVVE